MRLLRRARCLAFHFESFRWVAGVRVCERCDPDLLSALRRVLEMNAAIARAGAALAAFGRSFARTRDAATRAGANREPAP